MRLVIEAQHGELKERLESVHRLIDQLANRTYPEFLDKAEDPLEADSVDDPHESGPEYPVRKEAFARASKSVEHIKQKMLQKMNAALENVG